MRYAPFGFSNIAWPPDALDEALPLLQRLGCQAVEIAPFNVFKRWENIVEEATALRGKIEQYGLVCSALQGVLFGMPDVTLFGSAKSRSRLLHHLEKVAELAGLLGAGACVFGAPKQRDPGDLPAHEAWDLAIAALRQVGPAFADQGSALAFEANARQYGCRFVTTTSEAARLVAEVDAPGVRLQIDTGTIMLEAEPASILTRVAPLAVHVHISEPDLQAVGGCDHATIAASLGASGYRGSLSVEMKMTDRWTEEIPKSARFVQETYI